MPRPKKASAQAKAKRVSGKSTFAHVEDISEYGSVYHDSGEEDIYSQSDEDPEDPEDPLESIASLKRLYAVFLPPQLKESNPVSSYLICKFHNTFIIKSTG